MAIQSSRSGVRLATLWVVGAVVAIALGFAAAWAASRHEPADEGEAAREGRSPGISLVALHRLLQKEVAARRDLADEVASLRRELFELRTSNQRAGGKDGSAAPDDSDDEARRRGADAAR
jgi:hypothetical protein